MESLDTTTVVETPERVRFRYRVAGPGRRFCAWLIDLLIRGAVFLVGLLIVGVFSAFTYDLFGSAGMGFLMLLMFLLEWLYGAIFETIWNGRTPGKFAMGLRVVRTNGSPGQFPDFLLRNLVKGVDFLPGISIPGTPLFIPTFGISLVAMTVDPKLRRIGDWVGGTVVIIEERSKVLAEVKLHHAVTDEERETLPVRVRMSREEIQVVEEFLRRKKELSKARAEELAAMFAPVLREREGVEGTPSSRVLELGYARATGKDR